MTNLIHGFESESNFNAHETALSYFWLLDKCQIIKAEACKVKKNKYSIPALQCKSTGQVQHTVARKHA